MNPFSDVQSPSSIRDHKVRPFKPSIDVSLLDKKEDDHDSNFDSWDDTESHDESKLPKFQIGPLQKKSISVTPVSQRTGLDA